MYLVPKFLVNKSDIQSLGISELKDDENFQYQHLAKTATVNSKRITGNGFQETFRKMPTPSQKSNYHLLKSP